MKIGDKHLKTQPDIRLTALVEPCTTLQDSHALRLTCPALDRSAVLTRMSSAMIYLAFALLPMHRSFTHFRIETKAFPFIN